jgi:hypothetical protein
MMRSTPEHEVPTFAQNVCESLRDSGHVGPLRVRLSEVNVPVEAGQGG